MGSVVIVECRSWRNNHPLEGLCRLTYGRRFPDDQERFLEPEIHLRFPALPPSKTWDSLW